MILFRSFDPHFRCLFSSASRRFRCILTAEMSSAQSLYPWGSRGASCQAKKSPWGAFFYAPWGGPRQSKGPHPLGKSFIGATRTLLPQWLSDSHLIQLQSRSAPPQSKSTLSTVSEKQRVQGESTRWWGGCCTTNRVVHPPGRCFFNEGMPRGRFSESPVPEEVLEVPVQWSWTMGESWGVMSDPGCLAGPGELCKRSSCRRHLE